MTPTGWHWFGTPEGAAALIIGCDGRSLGLRYREFFESVVRAAAEIERAAVVAWLRSDHASACCKDSYADAIERGEHRG